MPNHNGRTALTIGFYPALFNGAHAPYDPSPEYCLEGESRLESLKRIFLEAINHELALCGPDEQLVTGFSVYDDRLSIFAPSDAVIDMARNFPFTTITLERF